mmetsp:Transcript_132281/g.329867  ORF Transcript_132281/g.329867 Transcript_132281/m.329867 type:complete len:131 (-) Transcript_132281:244-636(-)
MTKYVLCAFNSSQFASQRVGFLVCWEQSNATAATRAETCAVEQELSWDSISTCATGSGGVALAAEAAEQFLERFPDHATGMFGVPVVKINDVLQIETDFAPLLATLCETRIEAGACLPPTSFLAQARAPA